MISSLYIEKYKDISNLTIQFTQEEKLNFISNNKNEKEKDKEKTLQITEALLLSLYYLDVRRNYQLEEKLLFLRNDTIVTSLKMTNDNIFDIEKKCWFEPNLRMNIKNAKNNQLPICNESLFYFPKERRLDLVNFDNPSCVNFWLRNFLQISLDTDLDSNNKTNELSPEILSLSNIIKNIMKIGNKSQSIIIIEEPFLNLDKRYFEGFLFFLKSWSFNKCFILL